MIKSHKFLMIIILISALVIRTSIKSFLFYNIKADAVNNMLTIVIVWVPIVVVWKEGNKQVHLLTEGIVYILYVFLTIFMTNTNTLVIRKCTTTRLPFVFHCHFTKHFIVLYLVLQHGNNNYQ